MKKISIVVLTAVALLLTGNVYASNDQKGASEQAMENASDEAVFNRVGDWFATIGKSKEEKARIKAERKAARMKKKAEKKMKNMMKDGEDKGEKIQKKMKEMKKEHKGSSKQKKGS